MNPLVFIFPLILTSLLFLFRFRKLGFWAKVLYLLVGSISFGVCVFIILYPYYFRNT